MSYKRVMPRDLFNESKLLKCLGKVTLLIHEQMLNINTDHEDSGKGFVINQGYDGSLNVSNLYFYDNNGTTIHFSTPLNSKEPWPLVMEYKGEIYEPLNDQGEWVLKGWSYE